jgi:AraC-like DNA-binding protein
MDWLNDAYYPARVRSLGPAVIAASEIKAVRMTHMTIGLVRPDRDMDIEPGALGCYHVNVPVCGHVESRCGTRATVADPQRAAVFTPDDYTRLTRWEAGATQLCIKIRRQALEREAARLLGHPLKRSVDFALGLDLRTDRGAGWMGALQLLTSEMQRPHSLSASSVLYREQLETLLISSLVLAQHSSLWEELHGAARPLRPRTVQRVLELIESDPSRAFNLGDLAAHASVSARRLQQSFAEHVGATPTQYLRDVRLSRAHRDLLETDDPVGVVAIRWGFSNTGRFAAAYRSKYGRSPSEVRGHHSSAST